MAVPVPSDEPRRNAVRSASRRGTGRRYRAGHAPRPPGSGHLVTVGPGRQETGVDRVRARNEQGIRRGVRRQADLGS